MKKIFGITEGFRLFVLLMLFVEVGAILSHLTFDRTIFNFNIAIIIIGFILYVYHFLYKKEEKIIE